MHDIAISAFLLERIEAQVRAAPDVEVCGLLMGTADRIERIEIAANVAADPATSFEIDPVVLLTAHRAARRGGDAIVGHYHSHPSGSATPSARDTAAAEPGSLWLILTLSESRLWRAGAEGFEPVNLILG